MTDAGDFDGVERVVADDLRFRLWLGIGEDAYASIRYGKKLQQLWDVGGIAATGAGVAASAPVAGTFFGSSGIMAALGLGTAATPLGWIVAAGLVSAGAYYGVMRLVGRFGDDRVQKIPTFINSPVDLLGAALVDMIGVLAIKMAEIDGPLSEAEATAILDHFVTDWGIDETYAARALDLIAENSARTTLSEATGVLGRFMRENPDCNEIALREALLGVMRRIALADGPLDEREELALERVDRVLRTETGFSLARTLAPLREGVSGAGRRLGGGAGAILRGAKGLVRRKSRDG